VLTFAKRDATAAWDVRVPRAAAWDSFPGDPYRMACPFSFGLSLLRALASLPGMRATPGLPQYRQRQQGLPRRSPMPR